MNPASESNSVVIFAFYYFIFHLNKKLYLNRGARSNFFWEIDFFAFLRIFPLFLVFLLIFVARVGKFLCVIGLEYESS